MDPRGGEQRKDEALWRGDAAMPEVLKGRLGALLTSCDPGKAIARSSREQIQIPLLKLANRIFKGRDTSCTVSALDIGGSL